MLSLPADSSLKMFGEFQFYFQLLPIQIPVSVQTINRDDFSNSNSLHGVVCLRPIAASVKFTV
jgi:hypothetical protein